MNVQDYINKVLERVATQQVENTIFQSDNAKPHAAAVTARFFHDFTVFRLLIPKRKEKRPPV